MRHGKMAAVLVAVLIAGAAAGVLAYRRLPAAAVIEAPSVEDGPDEGVIYRSTWCPSPEQREAK